MSNLEQAKTYSTNTEKVFRLSDQTSRVAFLQFAVWQIIVSFKVVCSGAVEFILKHDIRKSEDEPVARGFYTAGL